MKNTQPESSRQQRGVLIIVENLPVPFDRRVWQEAAALAEAGYKVSVICPKGKGHTKPYEIIGDIHIFRHYLPADGVGAFGYLIEYSCALFWQFVLSLKILHSRGFDVIHACNPPDLIFIVAAFHKILFGKKFLFDQHDINPELYEVKFGKRGLFHRLLVSLERCTFRWADVSLATNERFKAIAVARGGMSPDRVWIVKSYPDLARFYRVQPHASTKQAFKYIVGYVGIMAQQDGVDLLVRAMAIVKHELMRHDIGCIIIGDGPELANLVGLSRKLGVEEITRFTGFLRGEELLSHLSAIDIGVIPDPPNACNDKLSMNKVFEYMMLGLPFVQFDLAQSRSEAGDASLVVSPSTPEKLAEGIVALLDNEDLRRRMSDYGAERARREFRWEIEKTALLTAYATLFSPAPA